MHLWPTVSGRCGVYAVSARLSLLRDISINNTSYTVIYMPIKAVKPNVLSCLSDLLNVEEVIPRFKIENQHCNLFSSALAKFFARYENKVPKRITRASANFKLRVFLTWDLITITKITAYRVINHSVLYGSEAGSLYRAQNVRLKYFHPLVPENSGDEMPASLL